MKQVNKNIERAANLICDYADESHLFTKKEVKRLIRQTLCSKDSQTLIVLKKDLEITAKDRNALKYMYRSEKANLEQLAKDCSEWYKKNEEGRKHSQCLARRNTDLRTNLQEANKKLEHLEKEYAKLEAHLGGVVEQRDKAESDMMSIGSDMDKLMQKYDKLEMKYDEVTKRQADTIHNLKRQMNAINEITSIHYE